MIRATFEFDDQSDLGVLLQAIGKSTSIRLVGNTIIETGPRPQSHTPKNRPKKLVYTNGLKDKGITSHNLIMEVLSDQRMHHKSEIQKIFVSRGFSPNTLSPEIGKMVRDGKVLKLDGNLYQSP